MEFLVENKLFCSHLQANICRKSFATLNRSTYMLLHHSHLDESHDYVKEQNNYEVVRGDKGNLCDCIKDCVVRDHAQ